MGLRQLLPCCSLGPVLKGEKLILSHVAFCSHFVQNLIDSNCAIQVRLSWSKEEQGPKMPRMEKCFHLGVCSRLPKHSAGCHLMGKAFPSPGLYLQHRQE